jgi:VWFA-related protein
MQAMANEAASALNGASNNQARTKLQSTERSGIRHLPLILALIFCCYGSECRAQAKAFSAATSAMGAPAATISKEVQEVGVVLTVTNWLGHFVKDLNETDLRILDNGHPVDKITYFQSQTDLPLRVGIVVDASASITNRYKFEKKAANAFLRRVLNPDRDDAIVVGFNENVQLYRTASRERRFLPEKMTHLTPGGDTAIYDAVAFTCKELAKDRDVQPARRALVLITDGEDNSSHISLQQAIESALRSDTIVYVLSTNPDYSLSLGERGEIAMKQLAEATGGRLLRGDSNDDVNHAFSKLDRELRNQYAIGYKPPLGRPDGLFHRLVVLGPKRLHIYHRQGYFAGR